MAFDESELTGEKKIKSDSGLDEGLDVPGAELDDANELIGEEDVENNYYSLGVMIILTWMKTDCFLHIQGLGEQL
ncbi:hypothetical protein [Daejeonella sp.]|uniref:hypothetical protein n=1 Tax=Daejeonella sp. TaxID=2805397 RepID=UPI00272F3D68|nr:hypothetical protein [Daejeonella sp.]MDP2415257.1 hypothetical protein [Daejeonella sp.]